MTRFRWDSWNDLRTDVSRLQEEFNRLLGRTGLSEVFERPAGYPAVNVWEDHDNIYVEAELPGLQLEDLEIYVNGTRQLTIQGERKAPVVERGIWHRQERGHGKFSRVVELTSDVDSQNVAAQFKLGVLLVKLPKREEVKPRRVHIKVD